MEWYHVLTIVGANLLLMLSSIGLAVTLFLWARKEATEDRRDNYKLIEAIKTDMQQFQEKVFGIDVRMAEISDELHHIKRSLEKETK